jgi:hypothetical protein
MQVPIALPIVVKVSVKLFGGGGLQAKMVRGCRPRRLRAC